MGGGWNQNISEGIQLAEGDNALILFLSFIVCPDIGPKVKY